MGKWKLVTVEPTPEMMSALWSMRMANTGESFAACHQSMLAASPSPVEDEALVEKVTDIIWPRAGWDGDRLVAKAAARAVIAALSEEAQP